MANEMKIGNFPGWILLIVAISMVVGVGVLTLDKFGDNTYYSETIANESFTAPGENLTVTLANTEMTAFTKVADINGVAFGSGNYSVVLATGVLTNLDNSTLNTTTTYYAYYTHKQRTTATNTALDNARDATADISNTWLSLIVTILVLSIILYFVVRSFGGRAR